MPTEDTDIVFFQWLRKKLEPQWHLHIQYKFGRVPHLLNRGSEVHHLFNGPDMICKSFCYGWSSPQPLSFALGDLQLYRIVWLVPDQRSGTASAELKHDEVAPGLVEPLQPGHLPIPIELGSIDLIIAQRLDEPAGYGNGWISAPQRRGVTAGGKMLTDPGFTRRPKPASPILPRPKLPHF